MEWISIKDRLPSTDITEIEMKMEDGEVVNGTLKGDSYFSPQLVGDTREPTHWRPTSSQQNVASDAARG